MCMYKKHERSIFNMLQMCYINFIKLDKYSTGNSKTRATLRIIRMHELNVIIVSFVLVILLLFNYVAVVYAWAICLRRLCVYLTVHERRRACM